MMMRFGQRFTDILEFSAPVVAQIRTDISNGLVSVFQFSKPVYSVATLARLDELTQYFGDQLQVRFYGHYGTSFNANLLKTLPSVQNLALDSLTHILNLDSVSELPNLKILIFGVYDFDDANFLDKLPLTHLKRLMLMENKKRNFDLRPLEKALNLEELFVQGHSKNIDAISQIDSLNQLVLSSCNAKTSLAFVRHIERLLTLQLILGGRSDIREVESQSLEQLEIVQVKGLHNLNDLSRFVKLSALRVEDQIRIESLDVSALSLRRLTISNCKKLSRVFGLDRQHRLEELFIAKTAIPVEDLFESTWPQTLRCLGLFGTSAEWNRSMADRSKQRGYSVYGSGWT
jgi:hypothetical protein